MKILGAGSTDDFANNAFQWRSALSSTRSTGAHIDATPRHTPSELGYVLPRAHVMLTYQQIENAAGRPV